MRSLNRPREIPLFAKLGCGPAREGRNGRVQGDILARVIRIEGHVEGNLQGEEVVILGSTGVVHGDLTTVRISMDEGCEFSGHVQVAANNNIRRANSRYP